MTGTSTLISVLEQADFQVLPKPLIVGGTTFDFDAAVTGTEVSHDLVIVSQTKTVERLVQLVSGLTRSLDRLRSPRPVTVILLGQALPRSTLARIEAHARIIVIAEPDPSVETITEAIAILLPISLPTASSASVAPLAELRNLLGDRTTDGHRFLLEAAPMGSEAVRSALSDFIDGAFDHEESL